MKNRRGLVLVEDHPFFDNLEEATRRFSEELDQRDLTPRQCRRLLEFLDMLAVMKVSKNLLDAMLERAEQEE